MEKAPTRANPPVPYDFCVSVPISHLLCLNNVLNVKALLGAINQEISL